MATEATVLEMMHRFVIELERVSDEGPLNEHIEQIADALHADRSLRDVAIGADLAAGRVEFELGALGVSARDALETIWAALLRAIEAGGGRVTGAFHGPPDRSEPGDPIGFEIGTGERWEQRRTELIQT
jgi:hypothetical protein